MSEMEELQVHGVEQVDKMKWKKRSVEKKRLWNHNYSATEATAIEDKVTWDGFFFFF